MTFLFRSRVGFLTLWTILCIIFDLLFILINPSLSITRMVLGNLIGLPVAVYLSGTRGLPWLPYKRGDDKIDGN